MFLRTLREDPADADTDSAKLLLRAGYVRKAAPGIWTWQPFEGNAGRQHGHRQDGHQRHVDTGMGQRIGRGRLAPGNYARVRARLGGRRATRRATRHGTGLVLLIAARRGAVRSGLRDDSTAGGSSERPSTVARMVPVRLFLFARVADAAVRPADAAEIHVRSRQRGCLHYARGSRLSYRPGQYVAERIIVAFISALSLTVIAIADFSNRMVEKNLVAIAAYVLLPALAATAWLRTCHPMADSATRNLRWIFGAAARYEASLESVQSLGKRISQLR